MKPVQANLLAEMARLGVTSTELAHGLGISERQITRWRTGATRNPRDEWVERVAAYFGRPVSWFYQDHSRDGDELEVA